MRVQGQNIHIDYRNKIIFKSQSKSDLDMEVTVINHFRFIIPTKINYGSGNLAMLPGELKKIGAKNHGSYRSQANKA